jgi:argininosuccinate synthase
MKSRGVTRTPGAHLHFAHRRWGADDGPRSHAPARLAHPALREVVYYGYWFCARRLALGRWSRSQKNITGTVRVELYRGNIMCSGRVPVSLYNPPSPRGSQARPKPQPGRRHRLHPPQRA